MTWIEALILGLIQGLTEFLPVSSSGHLEIGAVLLGVEESDNLLFAVTVHGATALSTIVVFRKEILDIAKGLLEFKWNESWQFAIKIGISLVPVMIVGLFFKDTIEGFFSGNLLLVGSMLLVTSALLAFTHFKKSNEGEITFGGSFAIGIMQAIAVLPGISRSGATIAMGLLLGFDKKKVTHFSFLMVLIPILGYSFLKLLKFFSDDTAAQTIPALSLLVGFVAAFLSGFLACTWMVAIVKKGKLTYFAGYCFIVGLIAIVSAL